MCKSEYQNSWKFLFLTLYIEAAIYENIYIDTYMYIYTYIYMYIYLKLKRKCYAHCSSSSMSTLLLRNLNFIRAALISFRRAKQLLSDFWLVLRFFFFFSVLVNEKGGGDSWKKKMQSVILEGQGSKKMSFCNNTFFEWPLILGINNFINV